MLKLLAYNAAVARNTYSAYEDYIKNYPDGKYVRTAKGKSNELRYQFYLRTAEEELANKYYDDAIEYYEKALRYKPGDEIAATGLEKAKNAKERKDNWANFSDSIIDSGVLPILGGLVAGLLIWLLISSDSDPDYDCIY